jgi:transcriptional regulator with XRE-family HTH domain
MTAQAVTASEYKRRLKAELTEALSQWRIGDAFRVHRVRHGYSQETFARRIRMHRTYYSAIERGEKNVTLQLMIRISRGLDVTLEQVMKEAGL